jgi:hypothetical protein
MAWPPRFSDVSCFCTLMTRFEISVQLDPTLPDEAGMKKFDQLMRRLGFARVTNPRGVGYSYQGESAHESAIQLCEEIEIASSTIDSFAKITVRGAGGLWSNTPP